MFDLLGTVLTGGATGIIGSILGKAFSFIDAWQEEKKANNEHGRTIALLELQNKLGAEESERELAIAETTAASDIRMASYGQAPSAGDGSPWVVDVLRLIRPFLTISLIILVGILYFKAIPGGRATIEASVIYMCSSSVLWWFGDRAMRKKK
jgi:hypothetical protein